MRRIGIVTALFLVVGLVSACDDQGSPTSPASEQLGPSFSSLNGFEVAGFAPFVSFGHGCFTEVVGTEVVDGVLFLTVFNDNIEVSTEERFAGPATNTATVGIDLATGDVVFFDITIQHTPTAVSGTWEVGLDDALIIRDRLIKASLSGVGTGDLAGLGIRYKVEVTAKASATPPHIVCEGDQPYLTTGKIFKLD